jgi:hypothetical protein
MKVKSPEPVFGSEFWGSYRSRVALGGPQIVSCGLGFGWAVVDGHDLAGFGHAGSAPAAAGGLVVGWVGVRLRLGAGR